MQDELKRSKKNKIYCKTDKSESQKRKPKKDKMDKSEPQKCNIYFKNEIQKIKKEINLLRDKLEQSKKRQNLLEKRQNLSQNRLKQIAKIKNLSSNDIKQITKMQNQSQDELEQIAEMRRIKNHAKMSKDGLIIALLKSKRSLPELFKNNFDNDKECRKKITKKLYEIGNKKNLSKLEKEEINEYLTDLERILNKKEKYHYHDRDDPDYYGIRDIEVLLSEADEKDYYKPILVQSAFNGSYRKYKSRGDKGKILSEKEYLSKIRPYLIDTINDHKDTTKINKSEEWKIQLCMHINYACICFLKIQEKLVLFLCRVIAQKL